MALLGKTGVGKTTLLYNMAFADLHRDVLQIGASKQNGVNLFYLKAFIHGLSSEVAPDLNSSRTIFATHPSGEVAKSFSTSVASAFRAFALTSLAYSEILSGPHLRTLSVDPKAAQRVFRNKPMPPLPRYFRSLNTLLSMKTPLESSRPARWAVSCSRFFVFS